MGARIQLVRLLQEFVAVDAVPASALRNQGAGVAGRIQHQLSTLELGDIPSATADDYGQWLDDHTEQVLDALDTKHRPWGTARKAINLFMRACVSNHYLRTHYGLARIECFAELPIDSLVATALKRYAGRGALPPWPGLKWLKREAHGQYQAVAVRYADQLGIHPPVYLDNYLWLNGRRA